MLTSSFTSCRFSTWEDLSTTSLFLILQSSELTTSSLWFLTTPLQFAQVWVTKPKQLILNLLLLINSRTATRSLLMIFATGQHSGLALMPNISTNVIRVKIKKSFSRISQSKKPHSMFLRLVLQPLNLSYIVTTGLLLTLLLLSLVVFFNILLTNSHHISLETLLRRNELQWIMLRVTDTNWFVQLMNILHSHLLQFPCCMCLA